MKKVIPVLIALVLICIVIGSCFGKTLYDKYSYGQEWADLNEYFQIFSDTDVPIILQDLRVDERAKMIDGTCYMDEDTVCKYFTERFYLDLNESLVLYTTHAGVTQTSLDTKSYIDADHNIVNLDYAPCTMVGDKLYIAVDYLKLFCNFQYELFTLPYHMQVYTEWGKRTMASVVDDTQVRWRAGVKSEILTEVAVDDRLEVIEELDDWTKVKTKDAFIGYLQHSKLSDYWVEDETPETSVAPENPTFLTHDYKINLTWHNIEFPQDGIDLKNALAETKAVNVVSPTWFWLEDNTGVIGNISNPDYAEKAHEMGLEVWALVSDFHADSQADSNELLSYTTRRRQLEDTLVQACIDGGADGINVDFESITSAGAPHFVQFIRELSLKCHENNLLVSVDNYVPTEYTAHYNRKAQSEFCDYIVVMGYDEHYKGCPEAGSVASVGWMTDGIVKTVGYVGKEKVINAIPFYTRVWKTKGGEVTSEAVDMETQNNFLAKNNLTPSWDEVTNQNYVEAQLGDTLYQVWMEDIESIKIRLNVIKTNEIAGVASWCLGQETPDVWDAIEEYCNN